MSQTAMSSQEQDTILVSNGQEPATLGTALPDTSGLATLRGDHVDTVDDSDEAIDSYNNDFVETHEINNKEQGVLVEEKASCCSSGPGSGRGVVLKSAGAAAVALVGAWAVRKILKTYDCR
jgi:MYXO-CTERM domain-containing protein